MRARDEQQCEAAIRHRLITAPEAAECRALMEAGRHGDFAALLLDRGLITGDQAEHLRLSVATTEAAPPVPGYEVLGEIGRGGMAVVYRARHRMLDRIDAVKVLPLYLAEDQEYVERFLREVRAAAGLIHPNIVRVYDAGRVRQTYYLAMEYIDGPSLEGLLRGEGVVSVDRAARLLAPVARALGYVHGARIIHRDVKPSNILLTSTEVPKLADLGLAKKQADVTSTSSSRMFGTVQYMAPEQARDFKRVDPRTDIYALGCTLYHALTGTPPFAGETPYEVIRQHETVAPPLVEQDNERLSGEVRRLVRRMLAKSPSNRPQSALEVAEALETIVGLRPPPPAAVRPAATSDSTTPAVPAGEAAAGLGKLLYDFETRRDLERVTRNNPDCPVNFSLTRKGAAGGGRALLAEFPATRGQQTPPTFHLLDFRRDWRKYRTFSLDIHNPQPDLVLLRVTIHDREGGQCTRTLELTAGPNHVAHSVAELAEEIDVANLARITFALEQDTPAAMCLDNIRVTITPEDEGQVHPDPNLLIVGHQREADYADFAEAYLAAQTGDVIELRSNDTRHLAERLTYGRLPNGRPVSRDVHVRAGAGFVPTFTVTAEPEAASAPRLLAGGAVTLEGLRLLAAEPSEGERYGYVLAGGGGPCRLVRCYLRGARLTWDGTPPHAESIVEFTECYFAEDCALKVLGYPHSVRFTNCAFWHCDTAVQIAGGHPFGRFCRTPGSLFREKFCGLTAVAFPGGKVREHPQISGGVAGEWTAGCEVFFQRCTFHGVGTVVAVGTTSAVAEETTIPVRVGVVESTLSDVLQVCRVHGRSAEGIIARCSQDLFSNVPALVVAERGTTAAVLEGPPAGQVPDLGLEAPERGDLRAKPDSIMQFASRGAPDHIAYPDFLYDLARQTRRTNDDTQPGTGIPSH